MKEGWGKGPRSSLARKVGVSLKCLWSHFMTPNPIGSQAVVAFTGCESVLPWLVKAGKGASESKPGARSPSSPLSSLDCHPSFALSAPKEGEGTQALLHPRGALPSASEARPRARVFPLPPGLAGFLTSSKPPSSLRKAPRRGAERKHAASVRNEDHVWGRRHQSAAARVGGVVKAPARPEARGDSKPAPLLGVGDAEPQREAAKRLG